MKRMLLAVMALLLIGSVAQSQITVMSPNGGESYPNNGQLILWWSNAVSLQVCEYLDRYDGDRIVQSSIFPNKGYYLVGRDYVSLSSEDMSKLTPGKYKFRVVGMNPYMQIFNDVSDAYFYITSTAKMSCVLQNTNDWLAGQTRKFVISWDGFSIGDPYVVYLFTSDRYVSEAYGFIAKTGIVETVSGNLTFEASFPDISQSIYPEYAMDTVDCRYYFWFCNRKNYMSAKSEDLHVIIDPIHIRIFEQKDFTSVQGKQITPLSFIVDTSYASNVVRSLTLPIIFGSNDTNAQCVCAIFDGKRQVSKTFVVTAEVKEAGFVTIEACNLGILPGTKRSLEIRCIPVKGIGLFQFGIDRCGTSADVRRKREDLTVAVEGMWGPVVTITAPKGKK